MFELIVYFATILVFAAGICGLKRRHWGAVKVVFLLLFIILGIIWNLSEELVIRLFLQVPMVLFMLFGVFQESVPDTLVCGFSLTMVHSILVEIGLVFCDLLGLKPDARSVLELIIPLMIFAISVILYGINYFFLQIKLKNIGVKYGILVLITLLFDMSSIMLLGEFWLEQGRETSVVRATRSIFCSVIVGIIFKFIMLIVFVIYQRVLKEQEALSTHYLEVQKNHFEYLQKREEDTRRFRHDLQKHLRAAEILLKQGRDGELQAYLKELAGEIDSLCDNNRFSLNNHMVNAIINDYYYAAEKKGIMLKVDGSFAGKCYLTNHDITIILGNLIDNAITAELETENREINITFRHDETRIYIEVENHINKPPALLGGLIKTTKKNAQSHGFGMKIIRECARRNGGDMIITVDQNHFKALVFVDNTGEER